MTFFRTCQLDQSVVDLFAHLKWPAVECIVIQPVRNSNKMLTTIPSQSPFSSSCGASDHILYDLYHQMKFAQL